MAYRIDASVAAIALLGSSGCPQGEAAPGGGNMYGDGTTSGTTGSVTSDSSSSSGPVADSGSGGAEGTGALPPIEIDCGRVPQAAVSAKFTHDPTTMGGDGNYDFSATGLPTGLTIVAYNGEIKGTPEESGDFDVDITVTDGSGTQASTTCTISVNEQLAVVTPLDVLGDDVCVRGDQTLLDFLVPDTGDGSPITCIFKSGNGSGRLPEGITVNADTCAIEGTITAPAYGTHAFIVRGEQNGFQVFMPYCVTQDDSANTFTVDGDHDGAMSVADKPLVQLFDPTAPLSVGTTGDPVYRVTDPTVCTGNSCYYGFVYSINSSPFDSNSLSITDSMLIDDGMGNTLGLSHGLTIGGSQVPDAFATRAWIQNVTMSYCLSADSSACDGVTAIQANTGAQLEISIIMYPAPG